MANETDTSANTLQVEVNETDKQALVELCEKRFKLGLEARRKFEVPALTSLLFWAGQQWESIEQDLMKVYRRRPIVAPGTDKVKISDNRIHQLTRQALSIGLSALPDIEGLPATYDENDVVSAQLATQVLQWRDRIDKEDRLRQQEFMWGCGTGSCYRRTFWDPTGGEIGKKEGDEATEVVNFFRVVIDPGSVEQWPPRWLIEYDARDVDWVKQTYGVEVEPESTADAMRFLDRLALNVMQGVSQMREAPQHAVVLKRMYVPPTEKYPQGQCVVWANGKFLKKHELQAGVWNWARLEWSPIPGRLYPMGFIEPLLSDQSRRNVLLSQISHLINCQIRGDMVGEGRGEPKMGIRADGGKMIYMPIGSKWEMMRYDVNLGEAMQFLQEGLLALKEKAGTNDPTLGKQAGKQVTLGELQMLREADVGNLAYHVERYSWALCDVAQHKLAMMAKYCTNQRVLSGVGSQAKSEIVYFRGSDLGSTRDVVAVPRPHLTPAMKLQVREQALDKKLAGPYDPANPGDQLAKRLELRGLGLTELEEEVERAYGPLDELFVKVHNWNAAQEELVVRQLEAALNPQPAPAPMGIPGGEPPGLPGPGGGVPPEMAGVA